MFIKINTCMCLYSVAEVVFKNFSRAACSLKIILFCMNAQFPPIKIILSMSEQ